MEKQPRLGYDMADGYWFDRSKPQRLSEQPQTYQECDPIAMVVELEAEKKEAFCQGARWWEFKSSGGTMWQSDQNLAFDQAEIREADGTLGVIREALRFPEKETQ